jgi:hypothetical protein
VLCTILHLTRPHWPCDSTSSLCSNTPRRGRNTYVFLSQWISRVSAGSTSRLFLYTKQDYTSATVSKASRSIQKVPLTVIITNSLPPSGIQPSAALNPDISQGHVHLNALSTTQLDKHKIYELGTMRDALEDATPLMCALLSRQPHSFDLISPNGFLIPTYWCGGTVGGSVASCLQTIRLHTAASSEASPRSAAMMHQMPKDADTVIKDKSSSL